MSLPSTSPASPHSPKPGTLYVVATPIGNLQDLTLRARTILSQVQAVIAEDTRHARHLMQCLLLSTPILSAHLRKEHHAAEQVLKRLEVGEQLALISDAGTPGVSDPGGRVVQAVLDAGYSVIPIPGACSAIAAWSASGFTDTQFLFYGFLPPKTQARQTSLQSLAHLTYPTIFYEAPHRIREMLNDLLSVFGNRPTTLARELTKTYETIKRAPLEQLVQWASEDVNVDRGEIIVIVEGCPKVLDHSLDAKSIECLQEMLSVTSLVTAVNWIQHLTDYPRDQIYQCALKLKAQISE